MAAPDDGGSDITSYQIDVLLRGGLGYACIPASGSLSAGDLVSLTNTADAAASSTVFEDVDDQLDAIARTVGTVELLTSRYDLDTDWFPARDALVVARAVTSAAADTSLAPLPGRARHTHSGEDGG